MSEPETSPHHLRILSIGNDPILLYSRQLILETAGYVVDSMTGEEVLENAKLGTFDLVLLCHSVPEDTTMRLLGALSRLAPQTPVLMVSRMDNAYAPAGRPVQVSSNPVTLLGAIALQLASHDPPAASRHGTH